MSNEGANSYIESFYDSYGKSVGQSVSVMIPATVIEYDRDTHVIKVQPLVAIEGSDRYISDSPLRCTCWRPFAGKFLIDIPLEKGDTGWVLAADSDTDNVKENCVHDDTGVVPDVWAPKTSWNHQSQHGVFFPDRWGKTYATDSNHVTAFDKDDKGRLVIQSEDGKQKISIGTVEGTFDIRIDAGSTVAVNASIVNVKAQGVNVESGSLDVAATAGVTVDAPEVVFKHGIAPANGANGSFTAGDSFVEVTNGIVTKIKHGA